MVPLCSQTLPAATRFNPCLVVAPRNNHWLPNAPSCNPLLEPAAPHHSLCLQSVSRCPIPKLKKPSHLSANATASPDLSIMAPHWLRSDVVVPALPTRPPPFPVFRMPTDNDFPPRNPPMAEPVQMLIAPKLPAHASPVHFAMLPLTP